MTKVITSRTPFPPPCRFWSSSPSSVEVWCSRISIEEPRCQLLVAITMFCHIEALCWGQVLHSLCCHFYFSIADLNISKYSIINIDMHSNRVRYSFKETVVSFFLCTFHPITILSTSRQLKYWWHARWEQDESY